MSEEKKLSKAEKKARKEAKKARKEEKKRKRSEDLDADDAVHSSSDSDGDAKEQKKKAKKEKKSSKSKSKSKSRQQADKPSAEDRKKDRAAKKAAKKAEKSALLAQVPTVDEHGISYTKIQIRRMTRRVKRGLPPVPTEEEERERLRQNRLDKEEEEKELAGMLHSREDEEDDDDSGDDGDDDEAEEQGEDIADDQDDNDNDDDEEEISPKPQQQQPLKKKTKRSKPVPADYTCMACQNKHTPAHWIYDCPDKERRPGSNHVKKKLRGINQPSSCKVFVSGLPFEIKSKDVEKYFALACGKVVHCKLLTFEDTKRCKGQAFITFEEEESAKKALKMTGEVLDYEPEDGGKKKKKKGDDSGTPKKALTLRVSKVKNRVATGGRKF